MRYSAANKLEIIQLVEQADLPQRRCLANLGIPRQTFYRWYDRYLTGGPEALADKPSRPERVWNRIPASNDPITPPEQTFTARRRTSFVAGRPSSSEDRKNAARSPRSLTASSPRRSPG